MRHVPRENQVRNLYEVGGLRSGGAASTLSLQGRLEDCLNYIMFRMLSRTGERGQTEECLFDMDTERDYDWTVATPSKPATRRSCSTTSAALWRQDSPLLAKSETPTNALDHPDAEASRPGVGNHRCGEIRPGPPISPNANCTPTSSRCCRNAVHPTCRWCRSSVPYLTGPEPGNKGDDSGIPGRPGEEKIYDTLVQYSMTSGNHQLQDLLSKFKEIQGEQARREKSGTPKAPKPQTQISPQERDFRSIVQVLERNGQRVSMLQLGSQRSRWLGGPPRDPSSPHKSRLHDVLDQMVKAGVLAKQGVNFVPGVNYSQVSGHGTSLTMGSQQAPLENVPVARGRLCSTSVSPLARCDRVSQRTLHRSPNPRSHVHPVHPGPGRPGVLDRIGLDTPSQTSPADYGLESIPKDRRRLIALVYFRRNAVGLTIHYELTVPKKWSIGTVREKLEALRQACMDLPVADVSAPGIHGRRVPSERIRASRSAGRRPRLPDDSNLLGTWAVSTSSRRTT